MHQTFQRLIFLILMTPGLCLIGCSREREYPTTGASLEGTVTYGTEKVPVALVIVQGAEGAATGFIGPDGKYKLDNVPLGEVNIGVNTEAGRGRLMGEVMAKTQGKASGSLPKVVSVPPKYFEPTTSGLKTTIQKGENTHNIVIPR